MSELLSELLSANDYNKLLPIIKDFEKNDSLKPQKAEAILEKSPATVRRYLSI